MKHKVRRLAAVLACAWVAGAAAQASDFKIAWTTIGEVVSSAATEAAQVQHDTKIARVDVLPTVVEIPVGQQVCLSSLQVRAVGTDGKAVAGVPLSISIRADQKQPLQLTPLKDICMRPARSGEYPIRFTSKVPTADDTLRSAQIFLRAK